ncbi:SPT3 Dosage dependent suppressor of Ty-induced promoter mutations-like protein [Apophysomyces ossiformis]|nr:SPT3 Dosage dependent suppressor of Ty-induced promoter mutations-like protein [Apophysomyces ossiformis]
MEQRKIAGEAAGIMDESRLLHLEADVVSESDPQREIVMCAGCVRRERKRAERKKKNSTSSDHNFERERRRILLFNCGPLVHFGTGDAILPTRITCYCRHHNESIGFRIRFRLRNSKGDIIASGKSYPIMITDDHKTARQPLKRSYTDDEEYHLLQTDFRQGPRYDVTPSSFNSGIPMENLATTQQQHSFHSTQHFTFMTHNHQDQFQHLSQHKEDNPYLVHSSSGVILSSSAESAGFLPEHSFYQPSYRPPAVCPSMNQHYPSVPSTPFVSPRIERLVPSRGSMGGGAEVTILGSGFYEGITCLFGDRVATTMYWSPCTLICTVPPTYQPGPVVVSLKGHSRIGTENEPATVFDYVDNSDQNLYELALQLVGMKMTGNVQDAKQVALRIVRDSQQRRKWTSTCTSSSSTYDHTMFYANSNSRTQ